MTLLEIAIGIAFAGGIIWVVGYTLVNQYVENAERIKMIESERVLHAIRLLQDQMKGHSKQTHILNEQLVRAHGHLKMALENEEQHIRSLELMRAYVTEKIGDVEGTLADGEIVRIGGNRFMFRRTGKV